MQTTRQNLLAKGILLLCLAWPVVAQAQTTAKEFVASGVAKRLKHDYDGAIAAYTRAIEMDPAYAGAYARRGNAELLKGDYAAADADIERAIELDPNDAYGYTSRGNAKRVRGDLAGAIVDFDRAIELDPKDTYAHLGRGLAKNSNGDLDIAIAAYTSAIQLEPKKAVSYYLRGLARHARDDYKGAIADYDRAIELDPKDAMAYLNRGLAKKLIGQLDAAIADYDRSIVLNPRHAMSFAKRGSARQDHGDAEGAAADYRRAIGLDPKNSARYHLALGELRFEQGKYAQAYEHASQAMPELRKLPDADNPHSDYKRAKAVRLLSAWLGGKISQLKPDDLFELLREQFDFLGVWAWAVPGVLLLMLAGLTGWTYGVRKRGPGLWLCIAWISVALVTAGIGFQLSLPGLNNPVGRWLGAIMVALACLASVWISDRERYFGTGPVFDGSKAWLRTAGVVGALMAGVALADTGYGVLYAWVFDKKLDVQLATVFLQCSTPAQFAVTLLVAGVAIPFYEEVFFRGFLFDAVSRRLGTGWAFVLTALAFATPHGLDYAPVLFLFALALGWLRLRSGNLRQCILLHSLNNTLAIIAIYFGKQ